MSDNEDSQRDREVHPSIQLSELPGKAYGITMEVPLFLTMMGISLSSTAIGNIILYRTCIHPLGHSVDECKEFLNPHRNNASQHLEQEVQQYATFVQTVKLVLESVGPAILSFFLGVWSDTHGRKPLVVWPLLGMTLTMMMVVVYAMMDNLGPWWYILTAVPLSLTGGYAVMFTGAFCYLSDITTTRNRSIRMTLLEATVSLGSAIGAVSSSYVLKAVGNVNLLLLVTCLYVFAYGFTNIYLRESLTGAVQGGISTVLDILLIKEMFRECFKRRPNNMRAQILLLTFANCLSIFILYGLIGLDYMYVREKLHWSMRDYTIAGASSTVIAFVGGLFGVAVVQRLLGISDLIFAIVALISGATEYIIRTFATLTWHIYFGASISLFRGLSSPLIRSYITKNVPVEDIAKVFSLMCAIEGICPLFSPPLYNSLYHFTISVFPGAVYILSAGLTLSSVVMLGFVQFYRYRASTSTFQRIQDES